MTNRNPVTHTQDSNIHTVKTKQYTTQQQILKCTADNSRPTADKQLSQRQADADREKLVRSDAANMQDMNKPGSQHQELFH